jgi:hypothetical protein
VRTAAIDLVGWSQCQLGGADASAFTQGADAGNRVVAGFGHSGGSVGE